MQFYLYSQKEINSLKNQSLQTQQLKPMNKILSRDKSLIF
jgi:hypothetical protein